MVKLAIWTNIDHDVNYSKFNIPHFIMLNDVKIQANILIKAITFCQLLCHLCQNKYPFTKAIFDVHTKLRKPLLMPAGC